jgi:AhpD family alkylhydroperoxidase
MAQRINYAHQVSEQVKQLNALSQSVHALVPTTLVDLVNIRVSQINGCAFCVDMHSKEAKIHGEKELRLYHTPIWRESPLFNERERAALEWAEAVTRLGEHGVSDEVFERVHAQFGDKELAALTMVVGAINFWNRLAISFRSTPGSLDKAYGLDKAGLSA